MKFKRKQLFGDSKITLEDIIEFCQQHNTILDDSDEAFVADFETEAESETCTKDSDETSPSQVVSFRFLITTKRLLLNSEESNIIHADTTYKMTIQRYPIIVIGTTDLDTSQHFHLLGFMFSRTQNADDFGFAFRTINEAMKKVAHITFAPTVLMADAAEAIQNAFRTTYGDN